MSYPSPRCRVCERWAMSDAAAELPDGAFHEIASPSGVRHLTEGSGYTACGRNCVPWEKKR